MAEHIFKSEQTLDLPRERVFAFFSDAANLELITPPELKFQILTTQPIEMQQGTLIEYRLSLHGIPMTWRTEITMWDPPNEFVDTQLSGPYSQWIHAHRFVELSLDKTLMTDEVRYRLPFEPFGDIAHFMVRGQIENIFDFRTKKIEELIKAGF